jgi:hypothetical protein
VCEATEVKDWMAIANCPVCGRDLVTATSVRTCGHVRADEGILPRFVLFCACPEHYEEGRRQLIRDPSHDHSGYLGEWEPRFGMVRAELITEPIEE